MYRCQFSKAVYNFGPLLYTVEVFMAVTALLGTPEIGKYDF